MKIFLKIASFGFALSFFVTTVTAVETPTSQLSKKESFQLTALAKKIENLTNGNPEQKKKAQLLLDSMKKYEKLVGTPNKAKVSQLSKIELKKFDIKRTLSYLQDKINLKKSQIRHTNKYYDYAANDSNKTKVFYLDFANKHLGGGVFGHGAVQEEIMFIEFPQLADLICKKAMMTRSGESSAGKGSPTPIIIENVKRVVQVNGYGKKSDLSLESISEVATVNILAIAAPRLSQKDTKAPTAKKTITDLFNTAVAGFTLAKKNADGKKCEIHTGPLGCGAFHNDRRVALLTQLLAAQYVGVDDVSFHGYETETVKACTNIFDAILDDAKNNAKTLEWVLEKIGTS